MFFNTALRREVNLALKAYCIDNVHTFLDYDYPNPVIFADDNNDNFMLKYLKLVEPKLFKKFKLEIVISRMAVAQHVDAATDQHTLAIPIFISRRSRATFVCESGRYPLCENTGVLFDASSLHGVESKGDGLIVWLLVNGIPKRDLKLVRRLGWVSGILLRAGV